MLSNWVMISGVRVFIYLFLTLRALQAECPQFHYIIQKADIFRAISESLDTKTIEMETTTMLEETVFISLKWL